MPSPVPNNAAGIAASRHARSLESDARLEAFYRCLRTIAREDGLAGTLQGIADQLNKRGLRTRGTKKTGPGLWNAPRVNETLQRLGLDRKLIERWRDDARAWAFDHGVDPNALLRQLWHEWLWHEKALLQDHGVGLTGRDKVEFDPAPLFRRPKDWVPPWERFPDSNVRWVPGAPPQARIVHLWLGAFEVDPDED